jgi:hypothetical protein
MAVIKRQETQMLQAPVSLRACWLPLDAITMHIQPVFVGMRHLPKLPVPFPFFPMVQTLWKAAGTGCWKPAMPKAINLQAKPNMSLARQMQLLCKLLPVAALELATRPV